LAISMRPRIPGSNSIMASPLILGIAVDKHDVVVRAILEQTDDGRSVLDRSDGPVGRKRAGPFRQRLAVIDVLGIPAQDERFNGPDFGVDLPGQVMRRSGLALSVDQGRFPIVIVSGRCGIGKILKSPGAVGQVAEQLEAQAGGGGRKVDGVGYAQGEGPEWEALLLGGPADDFQVAVVIGAQAFVGDRIMIVADERGFDRGQISGHVLFVGLHAELLGIGVSGKEVDVGGMKGILGGEIADDLPKRPNFEAFGSSRM